MRQYQSETRTAINRFLHHHLSFDRCIHDLEGALGRLIPRMAQEHLPELRTLMLANNELVMKEMERRWPRGVILQRSMEVFKRETREIIKRFFDHRLSFHG